jgi:hypothetical protein
VNNPYLITATPPAINASNAAIFVFNFSRLKDFRAPV